MRYVMNKSIRPTFIAVHWQTSVAALALLLIASAAYAEGDTTNLTAQSSTNSPYAIAHAQDNATNQVKSLTLHECIDRATRGIISRSNPSASLRPSERGV